MINAKERFLDNIERVKCLGGLYDALQGLTLPVLDSSDILRMQIVLSVSSLDALIHDLVCAGMIELFQNKRSDSKKFDKVSIRMSCMKSVQQKVPLLDIIKSEITLRNSYFAFQAPEKISEAINSFTNVKIWKEVSAKTTLGSSEDIQSQLKLIVERRNKIAHEADNDPVFPKTRWPIDKQMVKETVSFIETVGIEIYNIVKI